MFEVKDDHIRQADIQDRFYNILIFDHMIASRQIPLIGKFIRDPLSNCPAKMMLK